MPTIGLLESAIPSPYPFSYYPRPSGRANSTGLALEEVAEALRQLRANLPATRLELCRPERVIFRRVVRDTRRLGGRRVDDDAVSAHGLCRVHRPVGTIDHR